MSYTSTQFPIYVSSKPNKYIVWSGTTRKCQQSGGRYAIYDNRLNPIKVALLIKLFQFAHFVEACIFARRTYCSIYD